MQTRNNYIHPIIENKFEVLDYSMKEMISNLTTKKSIVTHFPTKLIMNTFTLGTLSTMCQIHDHQYSIFDSSIR